MMQNRVPYALAKVALRLSFVCMVSNITILMLVAIIAFKIQ